MKNTYNRRADLDRYIDDGYHYENFKQKKTQK